MSKPACLLSLFYLERGVRQERAESRYPRGRLFTTSVNQKLSRCVGLKPKSHLLGPGCWLAKVEELRESTRRANSPAPGEASDTDTEFQKLRIRQAMHTELTTVIVQSASERKMSKSMIHHHGANFEQTSVFVTAKGDLHFTIYKLDQVVAWRNLPTDRSLYVAINTK